jgi:hypothetical protein
MELLVNETELEILAYLHEHAEGFGQQFALESPQIVESLGASKGEFTRAAFYLDGWGLIGIDTSMDCFGDEGEITPIFLTATGEAYMRELDRRAVDSQLLQRGKRWTVAIVKSASGKGIDMATKLLTELAKAKIHGA